MKNNINIRDFFLNDKVIFVPQSVIISAPSLQKQQSIQKLEKKEEKQTSIEIPEGFVAKDFRGLSETQIWNCCGLFDYSVPGVLEKSVALFPEKLSLLKDHHWSVNSIIGYGTNFRYTLVKNGLSGIDLTFMIDTLVDAITARNVDTGAANRCSFALLMEIAQSHPDMKWDEFYDTMGQEIAGEIVRWLVTEILEWLEISLVWYGADASAKAHDLMQHYKSISKNKFYLGGVSPQEKEVTMDKDLEAIISMMKEMAGIECATVNQVTDAIKKIINENTNLKGQVTTLEGQVKEYKPKSDQFDTIVSQLKSSVLAKHKVLNGVVKDEDVDQLEMEVIQNAGYEKHEKMLKQKMEMLDKKIPMKCATCGSTNVSRRSSVETPIEYSEPVQPGLKPMNLK